MTNDAPQAGWYPNPDGSGGLRWWSGVGWTEYTRPNPAGQEVPAEDQPTTQLTDATQVQPDVAPTAAWPQPGATWGGPATPPQPPQHPGYGAYTPPPQALLTTSGMRPLAGMFGDIGRITRRAWFPILAISAIIWALVTAVLAAITVALIDVGALRRGLDAVGSALETNPEGDFTSAQGDEITSAFSEAFNTLPPAGWAVLGIVAGVLLLLASTVQIGAVNRLAMDATTAGAVSWGAAWRSGFVAGLRLFGYYVLLMLFTTVAVIAVTLVIVLAAQLAPALAVVLGILAFFGAIAIAFWLTGRLIPALAQAVVGRRALSWSWRATKGKFWAVLGRYLLWSLAASVIINVISTVVSIPVGALFLGTASAATDPAGQLGLALTLNLLLLPFTMALAAITVIGIVPVWRDLTDHPVYRSIDENGVPVQIPKASGQ
jgi:hypothetical protein